MAFSGTTQELTVNMYGAPLEGRYVEVQQGDTNSRTVRFYLKTFGDAEFTIPTGASVELCVFRTDKKSVVCAGSVEKGNSVLVTLLPEACNCAGKQAAQLCIYTEDGDIRSQIFYLRAPEAVYKKGIINPTDTDETTSGLSKTEKDLLLELLKSAAYTSGEMSGAYNRLKGIWDATPEEKVYYKVTNFLSNVTSSNAVTTVQEGKAYSATLTPATGYTLGSVKVTMGGTDITSSAYTASSRTVKIGAVTGNIVITATAAKQAIAVSGVTLNKSTASMTVGESLTLAATVSPSDATDKTVTWTSSSAAATVSNGTVQAVSAGSVTITAKAGSKTATCQITIAEATTTIPVQSVTFAETSGSLKVGETVTLTPVIAPSNATNKTVTWASSKPTVASVSGGLVKALTAGSTNITATVGGKTATYALTVIKEVEAEATCLYKLDAAKTFTHDNGSYIDTGVKLFENVTTEKPTYTILVDQQGGEGLTAASDTYCLLHCMEESGKYPGLSVAMLSTENTQMCLYGSRDHVEYSLANAKKRRAFSVEIKGDQYRINMHGAFGDWATITAYTANVAKSLILGAYQTSDGTKGRYWDGTVYRFEIWKGSLSESTITEWLANTTQTEESECIYSLPEETTFSPSAQKYIDTGVKLFESISTKPTWTILFDIDFGPEIKSVADTYCAFHCMEETSPWPGLSAAIWAKGTLGINIYGLALDSSQNTAVAGKRLKGALVINGTTADLYTNWGNKTGKTITNYSGNVSKTLILGAYQDASGNKGRYFDGTFHAFKVYKGELDSETINAFIE